MTRDKFAYDEEDDDKRNVSIVGNDSIMREGEHEIREVPGPERNSLFFKGTVAGAISKQAQDEPGFDEVTDGTPVNGCITNSKRKEIQSASWKRYLEDPMYAGILDAFKYFIIGRGIQVTAEDESDAVKEYLDKFMEVNKMDERDRDVVAKSLRSGEVFIRKFEKGPTGQAAKIPVIRFLNYWEISQIITHPKDKETVISYVRQFKEGDEIKSETIPAKEIIHIKIGAIDDQRALPPFMVIAQSCEWYKDWLFNRIVFNRLKTAYYLEEIVEGTPGDTSSVDQSTPDANKTSRSGKAIKRMPKVGSKITHNKAVEYKWLSPEVHADDAKEDGRAIRMNIAAGAQIPEFIMGDASQSNYASSLVAQNPFVRKIQWFQDFYESFFDEIFEWAIEFGIRAGQIPKISTETVMKERAGNIGFVRHMKKFFSFKEQFDNKGNIVVKAKVPTKTGVFIEWPSLIASDLLKDTQAYQIQQTMRVVDDSTISQKLGYDYEEELRKIDSREQNEVDDEDEEEEEGTKKRDDAIDKPDPDEPKKPAK